MISSSRILRRLPTRTFTELSAEIFGEGVELP